MKLYTKCTSCKSDFNLTKTYNTRPDLIADKGEYFNLNCSKCGTANEYHANDIKAKESYFTNFLGTILGLLVILITTKLMWNQGIISNVGLIIGGSIIAASNYSSLTSNVNAFNRYRATRVPKQNINK